jgi:hypothetical protein
MKKTISLLLLLMLCFGMLSIGFAANPGEALKDAGIIQGNGTSLGEDDSLTREAMVTILARINADVNFEDFEYNGESGFTDVPNDH